MELQKKIVQDYLLIYSNPTLKVISKDTGIQMTRVFRIMNGSRMKLDEYEAFKKSIDNRRGMSNLQKLIKDIQKSFSRIEVEKLEQSLSQKLRLIALKEG